GTAWGGEILYTNEDYYRRLGSLIPQKMAGGDLCTRYPARMLYSLLQNQYSESELYELMVNNYKDYFPRGKPEIDILKQQLDREFNVGTTTSTGRVLDAISTSLHICGERTYEGECAMKLESVAFYGEEKFQIPFEIKKENGRYVLDTSILLKGVMDKIKVGKMKKDIAFAAQKSLSHGMAALAIKCADKKGLDVIGGSGGVFYNEAISLAIKNYVEKRGYKFVQHQSSCAGDGSVSLGQAAIAAYKYGK
ncbi:MAG: carbamoyltransferase HypF, partial [Methanobacterium sp.]|nr:carbamoyltransferase HypF [Methanobacterium sp.]